MALGEFMDGVLAGMKIFISYRRRDAQWQVDRLYDAIRSHSGVDHVFFDQRSLKKGEDFVNSIVEKIKNCDLFIVIIGPLWNSVDEQSGRRRLDDASDWSRREIEIARKYNKTIIPVFIDETPADSLESVPDTISFIANLNGHRINFQSFEADVLSLLSGFVVGEFNQPSSSRLDPFSGLRPDVKLAVHAALRMEERAIEAAGQALSFSARKAEIIQKAKQEVDGYKFKKAKPFWGQSEDIYGLVIKRDFYGPAFVEVVHGSNKGDTYLGEYKSGGKNGYGVYHWQDGYRFEGEFAIGQPNGVGIYYWSDDSSYAGQEYQGRQHGYGTRRTENGMRFEGAWAHGKRNGYGVLRGVHGEIIEQGFYRGGLLVSNV